MFEKNSREIIMNDQHHFPQNLFRKIIILKKPMDFKTLKPFLAEKSFLARKMAYQYRAFLYASTILFGLYILSFFQYPLFHGLVELSSAAVATGVFMIAWNSRRFSGSHYFLFLGIGFLFAGFIDVLHTLAYSGMNIFTTTGSNTATQLWLVGRYLQAAAWLMAPLFILRRVKPHKTLFLFAGAASLLLISIFFLDIFPTAYVEGAGLTAFKKISEYLIMAAFFFSGLLLYLFRGKFDRRTFVLMFLAVAASFFSEAFFTLYVGVYDSANMFGHLFKLASFFLIYKSAIESVLRNPYETLFRNIKEHETALEEMASFPRLNPLPLAETDLEGNIGFLNPSAKTRFPDLVRLGPKHPWLADWKSVVKTLLDGSQKTIEREILVGDKHYQQTIHYLKNTGRIRVYSMDISKRKKVEELLQASEKKMREIIENTPVGISLRAAKKNDESIVEVNPEFLRIFGYDSAEEFKKVPSQKFYADPAERQKFFSLIEKGPVNGFEVQLRKKDGSVFWGSIDAIITTTQDGKKLLFSSLQDITSRKESQKKLKIHAAKLEKLAQDLRKFQLAVEHASDMIIITDPDGKIMFANRAVEQITGFRLREVIGKTPKMWGGRMPEEFYREMWKAIKIDKTTYKGELTNRRKNGEEFTAEIQISPVIGAKEKIIFFVGIERDISQEKEISRSKSEFISLASHQLRTPLTSINLAAEVLLQGVAGGLNREQAKYLKNIGRDIKGMAELIEVLLNVSRIEMGTFLADIRPNNLPKIINGVLREIKSQAEKKKIKIKKEFDKFLPDILVDKNLIRISMQNLISNSVKYTAEGGKITVSIKKDEPNILLSVSDTGFGIPESQQGQVFTKLFRASNVLQKSAGTGIGLYAIKEMIEKSGGSIWFTSKENKGTIFYISIPMDGMKKIAQKSS